MLHIQSSIEIETSLAEAYRLLADSERKARLNPDIEVLKIESVTDGPLAVGTRTFHSLRTANGVQKFHSEVVACETNRYIEWLTDTQPAFRVRQSLELTATGCLLVHEEWLDTQPELPAMDSLGVLLEVAETFRDAASMDLSPRPAHVGDPAEGLRHDMQRSLAAWLANIKSHLEVSQNRTEIDFSTEIVVGF